MSLGQVSLEVPCWQDLGELPSALWSKGGLLPLPYLSCFPMHWGLAPTPWRCTNPSSLL